jgi:hypothetical protein
MSEIQKRGFRVPLTWQTLIDHSALSPQAPGHTEVTPKSARWLEDRRRFLVRWKDLGAEGETAGFLADWGDGLHATDNVEDRKWVADA